MSQTDNILSRELNFIRPLLTPSKNIKIMGYIGRGFRRIFSFPSNTTRFFYRRDAVSFIHQWLYSPLLGPGRFFSFTVGRTGRRISQEQGPYLHTEQHKHRIKAHRHPYLVWDSNPRSQCSRERRQVHALDRAATAMGRWCLTLLILLK
jgi:hypothetical protein